MTSMFQLFIPIIRDIIIKQVEFPIVLEPLFSISSFFFCTSTIQL